MLLDDSIDICILILDVYNNDDNTINTYTILCY